VKVLVLVAGLVSAAATAVAAVLALALASDKRLNAKTPPRQGQAYFHLGSNEPVVIWVPISLFSFGF
jgi:hypothetical protein